MPHSWKSLPLAVFLAAATAALARDDVPWDDQLPEIGAWFRSLMQPDNPTASCCGFADAYEADSFEVEGDHYVAIITDGRADPRHGKPALPNGLRVPVPNSKMKWDAGNPTGHGVLFLSRGTARERDGRERPHGQVYCYVTPGGI